MTISTTGSIITGVETLTPIWMKKAKKYYDKSPGNFQKRVDNAIQELVELFPDVLKSGNVKEMQGTDDIFRYRVGDFRILFSIIGENLYILEIGSRGDIYK